MVLYVETEMHYVTILGNILLAFHIELACLAYGSLGTKGNIVIIFDNLCADESLLKISVDNTGTLRCFHAAAECPGT